jgi:hypothetical protein
MGSPKETPGNPWRNRRFFVGKKGQTMSKIPMNQEDFMRFSDRMKQSNDGRYRSQ